MALLYDRKGHDRNQRASEALLLNPAWSSESIWWLDRSGFNKRPAVTTAWPNQDDPGPGRTRTRPGFFFFFQMWGLKSISIYTLCSQEKSHVFSTWDKKSFGLNTST